MINNEANFRQCLSFEGLKDGKKLATDIDCFLEFNDRLFIFIEIKHQSCKEIPLGQRIALERLCKRLNTNSSSCYVLVGEHNIPNNQIIDICQTKLIAYSDGYRWKQATKNLTLLEAINNLKKAFLI